jgi:hypothetical protein
MYDFRQQSKAQFDKLSKHVNRVSTQSTYASITNIQYKVLVCLTAICIRA